MTTWTKEDERKLEEMRQRKRQAEIEARKPVETIAEEIHCHNIFAHEIASGMIKHADTLVAALKPFCSLEGPTVIDAEFRAFLNGMGTFKGVQFGEGVPDGHIGAFWWRKYL